jgi:hypothetical protein
MPYCPKTKFSLSDEHYVIIPMPLISQTAKNKRLRCWLNRQLYLGECGLVIRTQGATYQNDHLGYTTTHLLPIPHIFVPIINK